MLKKFVFGNFTNPTILKVFCVPNLHTRECSSTKQASNSKFHTQHLQNALAQYNGYILIIMLPQTDISSQEKYLLPWFVHAHESAMSYLCQNNSNIANATKRNYVT